MFPSLLILVVCLAAGQPQETPGWKPGARSRFNRAKPAPARQFEPPGKIADTVVTAPPLEFSPPSPPVQETPEPHSFDPAVTKAVHVEPVPVEAPADPPTILPSVVPTDPAGFGCVDARNRCGLCDCPVVWLRPWTCEALEMKPFEPKAKFACCNHCHSLIKNFLCCVPEEKKDNGGEKKNGDGKDEEPNGNAKVEKQNGNGEELKKNGDSKDTADKPEEEKKEGEKKQDEEKEETLAPLRQLIQCASPRCDDRMKKRGDNVYGWVWGGFTANFDSPNDHISFGTNFNWRSNDYRQEQIYFIFENPLEHDKEANVGYRVDFYTGHQAPFLVANGLFSDFTGFDPTSGYGVEGVGSFRRLNRVGIDLPQFYLNAHLPFFLTERGIDLLVGKFWTLMGHEVYTGPLTEFYSRSYEIIYGTPFTHTGILATLHATDTWDVSAGIVRGWDVFEDNNHRTSFTGNFVWNSCDKRWNWTTAWITGPEQYENDDNYRSLVTSYVVVKFGRNSEWQFVSGGHMAWEANAAPDSLTGTIKQAEWYGYSNYLFYTVDPRLILGTRVEWFRDDDGVRTAVTKRPGFAGNFFEVTLGATYRSYQNLRFRPEIRFDWFDGRAIDGTSALPYNDLLDSFQLTAAFDVIWEF